MPTYEYETLPTDGRPPVRFEVQQRMSDPPLEVHPQTGEPVQRVISAAFVVGGGTSRTPGDCNINTCGMGACGMGACGPGGCSDD
jgi:hypothetical protein